MTHRQFAAALGTQFCGSTLWKHAPSRERLSRVATILDDAEMDMLATNDVFWDELAAGESRGEQPVYHATAAGRHNFVTHGTNLHHTIEPGGRDVVVVHTPDR